MKNVLVVADSFKESLSSYQVGSAIKDGLCNNPNLNIEISTLADGGEGTMELLTQSLNGVLINTHTRNPLGQLINTSFGLSKQYKTAIIDVATSSGIELLEEDEKNPMLVSSYGTGELIAKALEYNIETIILGLGSSATVDLGFGMLSALGFEFLDENEQSINITGATLRQITRIDCTKVNPKLKDVKFKVACDVDNVLTGNSGSCHTFAKQKGATPEQIDQLEAEFIRLNQLIIEATAIDLNKISGSGAAGGIGGSAYAFLDAELVSGSDLIVEVNDLESKVIASDVVVTGEGRFDAQSLHGKGPMSIIDLAQKHNKQVIVICGSVDNQIYAHSKLTDVSIFASITKVDTIENTLADAYSNIKHIATAISNLL